MSRLHRAALALMFGFSAAAADAATFQLVTTPGGGFDDATPATPEGGNTGMTLGQQRTILFQTAVNTWGSALASNRVIKVNASFATLSCSASSGTLGSAGAATNIVLSDSGRQRYFPVALAEALLDQELNGAGNEINTTFNARIDLNDTGCLGTTRFYYGLTGPAPAGTIALYPVVLHELGHGLGFAALICRTPAGCTSPTTPYGGYFNGIADIWSDFLRDNDIDGSGTNKRWSAMTNAERVISFTHDPLLVWDGMSVTTNLGSQVAVARNEGRMRMYAPNPLVGGSSISHFHSDASPNLLMEPSANADVFNQTDLADCLLADVGWENSRCSWIYNNAPTLDAIADPAAIAEDGPLQNLGLSGISDGDAIDQALTVTAASSNPALIPHPSVSHSAGATTGSLSYTPAANQSGSAVITVTVRDDGGVVFGTVDTTTRTFTVNVTAVNDAPAATNLSVAESYTEDTALNLVDIVASDMDSANVTATLTLSSAAAGSLTTATAGAVTSTFNAGTGLWSASGAIADVNTLLAGVSFVPAANSTQNFTIATSVGDGVAPALTGSKAMTGVVTNDAPTATNLSTPETYTEDTTLNLADIVVGDVDTANVSVTLTLSPAALGALTTATSGAVTSTYNAGTGVWSAGGAIANVNTLLAGVSFVPAANGSANGSIATSVGDGVAPPVTGSKTLTGSAVNDAPTATNLSAAETYTEDTALNLTDIVASDIDSATVTATLTLSNASAGALNTATSGSVTSTYAAGTGIWNASGPIANVNTLLAGLTFTPAANFAQNFAIATSVGDGVATPVTGSKTMTGTAVNDAPGATNLSAAESYTEDTTLNLADIVVSDVDTANVTVTLTLSPASLGALTTATSGAVTSTYTAGTGVWSASGAIANVNTLLAGVSFVPTANGSANGSIATSVGDGAAAPVTGSKTVTGTAVNDAPSATNLSAAESYTEDTSLNLIDIVASDVDSATVTATLTLSNTSAGTLTTATSGAVTSTFTAGTGVWSASGAIANVNTLLAGVSFVPAANFAQTFSLATSLSDGAAPPATGSKTFTATAVNDAPSATNTSAAETYIEDTALNLVDIVVGDVDTANLTVTLTLSPASLGALTTATAGAVTSTYTAGTGVWSASGAIADVNALLAGVSFVPAANGNANGSIAVSVGDGVATPVTGSKTLTGTPVNDAASATNLSAAETYTEDTALNLVDIVVADVDTANVTVTLTLSPASLGALTTATAGAVTSTYNAGTGVWSASGAIANVNTLLAGVSVVPTANGSANGSIATSVSDGVAPPATGSKTLTGMPANDAPVVNAPAALTLNEDETATLTTLGVGDVDNSTLTITLDASHGTLTLVTTSGLSFTLGDGTDDDAMAFSGSLVNIGAAFASVQLKPQADYNGSAQLVLTANDTSGPVSAQTHVQIDAVVDTADDAISVDEDGSTAVFNVLTGSGGAAIDSFEGPATLVQVQPAAVNGVLTFQASGSVSYTPNVNFSGGETFTYTVSAGGTSETGSLTVTTAAINDAPTLAAIPNPAPIPPNAGLQTIALSGIGAGPGENQGLTVTAVSSNPALVPSVTVNYASPAATGSLTFTTAHNAIGSATITVTVTDDGGTANGGINTVSRSFLVQVGLDVIFINGFQ
ncbi:MAG TPA: Ig-like domain-containing protein [Tahibacter sp.]|uniref:beta strand repeat-containing protein n=1 Tax=Tahibacter sp. TaxID=2056211 RepID=UPI002B8CE200|nr:Ig-like domain-containing protein [Tahibacter sp.]HSX58616.1 Ig-like domain-containing protein [Tahibacter sp.]